MVSDKIDEELEKSVKETQNVKEEVKAWFQELLAPLNENIESINKAFKELLKQTNKQIGSLEEHERVTQEWFKALNEKKTTEQRLIDSLGHYLLIEHLYQSVCIMFNRCKKIREIRKCAIEELPNLLKGAGISIEKATIERIFNDSFKSSKRWGIVRFPELREMLILELHRVLLEEELQKSFRNK